jgi:F-type H+-transporting ATPase subunit alpha
VEDIGRFENQFLDSLRRNNAGLLTAIRESRNLTDDNIQSLQDAINAFKGTFQRSGDQSQTVEEESEDALGHGEHAQESVPRYQNQNPAPADGE